MIMQKRGKLGEDIAVDYLQANGFKIIDRNFFSRTGEIDIIAEEGEVLCFIEVKYYQQHALKNVLGAVDDKKQQKILRTVNYYLYKKKIINRYIRFDTVLIEFNAQQQIASLNFFRDAFRG